MPERKGTPLSVRSENRRRRYENRTKLENKLGHELPSTVDAHHKKDGGLTAMKDSLHGSKHGRGIKVKPNTYLK